MSYSLTHTDNTSMHTYTMLTVQYYINRGQVASHSIASTTIIRIAKSRQILRSQSCESARHWTWTKTNAHAYARTHVRYGRRIRLDIHIYMLVVSRQFFIITMKREKKHVDCCLLLRINSGSA